MKTASTAFKNAFNASDMYLDHRVIVEFGSNRFNDGQVVTASGTKIVNTGIDGSIKKDTQDFWKPEEVFNNKNRNTMKWLVCDRGATAAEFETGSGYRAINLDDGEYERGWWSENKSDGSGNFASPEFVQSEFFEDDGTTPFVRRINKIALYLTEGYRTMKEVTVSYKDELLGWTDVATNYAVPDETYIIEWDVDPYKTITGLRVDIHATWDTNDYARVSELQGYYTEDISEDIINVDVRQTRQEYDGTVPVGITSANDLSLTVDNTTGRYNIKNEETDLYPYVTANNRVTVEFGIDVNQGVGSPSYEYVPMGEFWVDEWQDDGGGMTATLNARDFSKFLQDEVSQFSRVWRSTNINACFTDLMARSGKMPGEEINIDEFALRGFDLLFVKDQTIWSFMQEVAFADQGIFGFDVNGDFYYHSYNRLNTAPYDSSVYSISYDTNLIEGSVATELYVNKVIAKVSPVNLDKTGTRQIWSAPTTILQWTKLGGNITADATTIPVKVAPGQSTVNLTVNNWDNKNGYLWLPTISGGEVTGGEIIKYGTRTDSSFTNCERGYFGTEAAAHNENAYIGEVAVYDIEFDNSPALVVNYPFVSMIDSIVKLVDEDHDPQAHIIIWDSTAFGGKLVIGNIVNYKTPLAGSGLTYKDSIDGDEEDDVIYDFVTLVSGEVSIEGDGIEEVGRDDEINTENKDYIRRYGKNELTVDNMWIQSKNHAQDITEIIIDEYRNPREVIRAETIISPHIDVADRVSIVNYPQLDIENIDYHIISISWQYDGGLRASVELREVKP